MWIKYVRIEYFHERLDIKNVAENDRCKCTRSSAEQVAGNPLETFRMRLGC